MSSRVRPRHCVLLGAAVAMSLNPVGGNALAGTAVGSAHEAPAVVLGGGESGELPTRSATRLDFLEDELTSPDDLFADVARDPKTGSVGVSSPKGTREWSASALSDHGMPVVAERAYRNAARRMAGTDPACQLPWTLLAGIGRVESDHGRYGGSTLGRDGVSHPLIIGVQLNGAGPVAAIPDSDNGKLDKDKVWDRAVGPMQFIPTTWATAGRDGDGDGVASPNDIDDATLAAAGYLCSGSGSVLSEAGMAAALLRYNPRLLRGVGDGVRAWLPHRLVRDARSSGAGDLAGRPVGPRQGRRQGQLQDITGKAEAVAWPFRWPQRHARSSTRAGAETPGHAQTNPETTQANPEACLLYTSDAADDLLCVDL